MPSPSPSRAGFDIVIRRPALVFAEIAWRWCFGLASLALLALTCVLFLNSIRVTDGDMQLMRSGSPWIAADVLARLLGANSAPLLRALAVLIPGIAVLWALAAAVGRAITTPPLIREGHDRTAHREGHDGEGHDFSRAETPSREIPALAAEGRSSYKSNFPALFGISFLRATLMVALIAGYFSCALIAAAVSNAVGGPPESRVGTSLLVFLPLFLLLMLAWALLNWFLSIAPVFAVRDARPTLAAFSDTVRLFSSNKRDFIAIGAVYGLTKTIAIVIVTVVGFVLLAAFATLPKLLLAALILITLLYFAFADLLNLARLASYAVLAEVPAGEPSQPPSVVTTH